MRRKLQLGLGFVLVALVSAVLGALFLAPLLTNRRIVISTEPLATAPSVPLASVPTMTTLPSSATPLSPAPTMLPTQAPTSAPTPTVAPLVPTVSADLAPGDAVLMVLNDRRQAAGCEVGLLPEARLGQTAQAHAEDMARTGVIDHMGSDGTTYEQRLDRIGYRYVRRGENIAAGYGTPADIVAIWMDEPADGPHRTNILNCAYREAGVGLARRDDGYQYWVLDLAEPIP